MNKILQVSAATGVIALTGALVSCAAPGTNPDREQNTAPTIQSEQGKRRGLAEPSQQKAPGRPVDIESVPYTGNFGDDGEIQEFRIVVDEVWRYCLVNAKGGMACFNGADAP